MNCEIKGCPRPGLHKRWMPNGKVHSSVLLCGPCLAKANEEGAPLLEEPPPLVQVRGTPREPCKAPHCVGRVFAQGRVLCRLHHDRALAYARTARDDRGAAVIGKAFDAALAEGVRRILDGVPLVDVEDPTPTPKPKPKPRRKPAPAPAAVEAEPTPPAEPEIIPEEVIVPNPDPLPTPTTSPPDHTWAPALAVDFTSLDQHNRAPSPPSLVETFHALQASLPDVDAVQLHALSEADRAGVLVQGPAIVTFPPGETVAARPDPDEDDAPAARPGATAATLTWVYDHDCCDATLTATLGDLPMRDLAQVERDGSTDYRIVVNLFGGTLSVQGSIPCIPDLGKAEAIVVGILAAVRVRVPPIPAEIVRAMTAPR